jgi:predicted CDP-diglyceride synthetase/phosphatidate cytidylyltransferase
MGQSIFGPILGIIYLLVASLAVVAARSCSRALKDGRIAGRGYDEIKARATTWWVVAAILLVVGLFLLSGAEAAMADSFGGAISVTADLAERRQQQFVYLAGWCLVMVPLTIGLLVMLGSAGEAALFGLAVTLLLLLLVGIRALAIEDINRFLGAGLHGVTIDDAIELVGLIVLGGASAGRPSSSGISAKPASPRRPRYRR